MSSDLVGESARRLFAQHSHAPTGGEWSAALWQAVEEAGFALALLTEEEGGFGLAPEDAMLPLRIGSAVAAPGPLAETMLVNWLLARAGLAPVEGPAAVAFGAARRVPWGRVLASLLVVESGRIALHDMAEAAWRPGANIAGEPRDDLAVLPPARMSAALDLDLTVPGAMLALLRAQQIAGAVQGALELSVRYAGERVQFGRTLAKFQAIQQYLAVMAGEAAAAGAAAIMGARALPLATSDAGRFVLLAGAAKLRTGEAAGKVADLAHQIHGAIGFSEEYPLHSLTRRLWSWRDEAGREAEWAETLGRTVLADRAGGLWPRITRLQAETF